MTATTADDLRTNLIGAWALQSYESSNINGSSVTHPWASTPKESSCTPPTGICRPS
jgi:hypothetical protein